MVLSTVLQVVNVYKIPLPHKLVNTIVRILTVPIQLLISLFNVLYLVLTFLKQIIYTITIQNYYEILYW